MNLYTPYWIVDELLRSLLCWQSDVVHQSVFELIHTDDRAMFRQQLHFALNPPNVDTSGDGKNCDWKEWKRIFYSSFNHEALTSGQSPHLCVNTTWVGHESVVHGSGKRFWRLFVLYLYLCSQFCRVVVIQWCTVLSSFLQRTLPSWRGALFVASVASWTIPLAFWLVPYLNINCQKSVIMWLNYFSLNWKTHLISNILCSCY